MSVGKLAVWIPIGLICLIGGARAQFDEGGKTPDQARVGQPPEAEFQMGRLAYAARGSLPVGACSCAHAGSRSLSCFWTYSKPADAASH